MSYKTFFYFLILSFSFLNADPLVDPLASWNEGPRKMAILTFIKETTEEGENYIAPEARIATFDQDGTLWVEHPLYVQSFFALDRVKALASSHPEWKNQEPYKAILNGDLEKIKTFTKKEMIEIVFATHSGMSIDAFHETVRNWLKVAVHPRFKKPFTSLVYQPMREVMELFEAHGYKNYIVSGGGQEFIRATSKELYHLMPDRILGTAGKVKYEWREGDPQLLKMPAILLVDDKAGKPEMINLLIGQRSVAAFGNSDGDREMLQWTSTNPNGKRLAMLVHHDDPIREYAYGPDTKIGTFSDSLMEEAIAQHWGVISMKEDWKTIF